MAGKQHDPTYLTRSQTDTSIDKTEVNVVVVFAPVPGR